MRLVEDISSERQHKTIIFTQTKRKADELSYMLRRSGFSVNSIHGDKKQNERDRTLAQFKKGEIMFLVATDVAARGLGIFYLPVPV
jgi:ATP-dependent RNA helicase DDX5/DBP2